MGHADGGTVPGLYDMGNRSFSYSAFLVRHPPCEKILNYELLNGWLGCLITFALRLTIAKQKTGPGQIIILTTYIQDSC